MRYPAMSGSGFESQARLILLVAEAAWARREKTKTLRSLGKGFITSNTASMEIISKPCAALWAVRMHFLAAIAARVI